MKAMFKRERDHPTGSTEPTGSTQSKDQTVPTEPTEPTEQQQKQPKTLLEKVYKITVPVDDDTCGKELAGTSFQATLVHYHVEAKAWVIRHIHTGAHYFVNHEFFTEPVRTEPRLTPVKERRAMQVLFQPGAKTDLGEDVGGTWEDGYLLLEFENDWCLMRVPRFDRTDFYGGYANFICDNLV